MARIARFIGVRPRVPQDFVRDVDSGSVTGSRSRSSAAPSPELAEESDPMPTSIAIPSLPIARVKALSLVSNLEPSYDDLGAVVSADPALTAAVLRAANSAVSSPIARLRTSRLAMVRLGIAETRRIVLAVALSSSFRGLRESGINQVEIWRHLIATAVVADALAWGEVNETEAFTAGLLHDLGRLALAGADPERYFRVVQAARRAQSASEAERELFGVDHCTFGEEIGRTWGFPSEIVEAIAEHHGSPERGVSWVVTKAREISGSLGIGDGVIDPEPLDPDSEAAALPVIEDMGGSDAILRRVGWYQGAMAAAA